jgi:hypothetical protein
MIRKLGLLVLFLAALISMPGTALARWHGGVDVYVERPYHHHWRHHHGYYDRWGYWHPYRW